MGKLTYAVIGCTNSSYRLDQWKRVTAFITQIKPTKFTVVNIPSKCITFLGLKGFMSKGTDGSSSAVNTPWKPCSSYRACSEHFVDSIPTVKYPDPTLNNRI